MPSPEPPASRRATSSPTAPRGPDDEEFPALAVTLTVSTLQDGGRIHEATMFLDGEEVFRYEPDDEEAQTFAIPHHVQFGSRRGLDTVDIRLDRLETSPTPVQIRILAFHHADPLNTEQVQVPDDVREGEVVRVVFEA